MSQTYEFRARWSRFPDHKPPSRGLYLITRHGFHLACPTPDATRASASTFVGTAYYIEENCQWMDTRTGKKYDDVVAWMPRPKPCEPLPVDYWHPDQIAARRYMGEEDEE